MDTLLNLIVSLPLTFLIIWISNKSGIANELHLGKFPKFLITFVLGYIIFFLFDVSRIEDYKSGLVTELIGIIVTTLFVQHLFDRKSEKDAKNHEMSSICAHLQVLNIFIDRYIDRFYWLSTPLSKRTAVTSPGTEMPQDFTLSDLKEMNEPTLRPDGVFSETALEGFFRAEKGLRAYIITVLSSVEFKHYISLRDSLTAFIETSLKYDVESVIKDRNEHLNMSPSLDTRWR